MFVDHVDIAHPSVVQAADQATQLVCTVTNVQSGTSGYSWLSPANVNTNYVSSQLTQYANDSQVSLLNKILNKESHIPYW